MPIWVLAPLFVGTFIVLALLVFAAVLRWGGRLRNKEFNSTIGNFASVVQALFGLTLALVIVTLFQNYRTTQSGVRAEATGLAELARLSSAFPANVSAELRNEIAVYVHDVRTIEWRTLRDGRTSARSWGDIGAMYATLKDYNPSSASQKSFYSQALSRLDDIVDQRRDALASTSHTIPAILQALLILAAIVTIMAPMFLVTVSPRFQAAKVIAVTSVVATALFAATVLSYPFSRALPVSNAPLRASEFDQLAGPLAR